MTPKPSSARSSSPCVSWRHTIPKPSCQTLRTPARTLRASCGEGEHPEEAEPLLREALECYRTLAASDPDEDGLPALIPEAGPPMGVLATILAEEGRAKEAEELFREGLSMYAILAQAHPEREDFRLGEEAFRESLAQLSAGV